MRNLKYKFLLTSHSAWLFIQMYLPNCNLNQIIPMKWKFKQRQIRIRVAVKKGRDDFFL